MISSLDTIALAILGANLIIDARSVRQEDIEQLAAITKSNGRQLIIKNSHVKGRNDLEKIIKIGKGCVVLDLTLSTRI